MTRRPRLLKTKGKTRTNCLHTHRISPTSSPNTVLSSTMKQVQIQRHLRPWLSQTIFQSSSRSHLICPTPTTSLKRKFKRTTVVHWNITRWTICSKQRTRKSRSCTARGASCSQANTQNRPTRRRFSQWTLIFSRQEEVNKRSTKMELHIEEPFSRAKLA